MYFFNTRIRKYLYKEFWPKPFLLIPVFIYIFYLGVKARSFLFFSAINPGIPLGGLTGDSKYPLLKQIPHEFLPKTLFVKKGMSYAEAMSLLESIDITLPFITKPDLGEGGIGVEKIHTHAELAHYMEQYDEDFLIQEYIPGTNEITLMYYRFPGHKKGSIDFIATKEFLSVIGDGVSNLGQLVRTGKRTRLFERIFRLHHRDTRHTIIPKGTTYMLQFKGNHTQGTALFDGSSIITPQLHTTFDAIADHIDGFFFGRYDIKYDNLDTFMQGRSFKILDLNGTGAEPLHANDPKYSVWDLWKIRTRHRRIIYQIARINHKNGTPYATIKEYKQIVINFQKTSKKFAQAPIKK